jgi:hypothetical protein
LLETVGEERFERVARERRSVASDHAPEHERHGAGVPDSLTEEAI